MKNKFYVRSVRQFYDVGLDYLLYFRVNYSIEELYDFFDTIFQVRIYDHNLLSLLCNDIVVAYLQYEKKYDYYVLDISGYEAWTLYNILVNEVLANIYYFK